MSLNLDKSTWKRVAFGDVVRQRRTRPCATRRRPVSTAIIAMEHMDPGELEDPALGLHRGWDHLHPHGEARPDALRQAPRLPAQGRLRRVRRRLLRRHLRLRGRRDTVCSGSSCRSSSSPNEFFDHALDTSAGSLSPRTNWRDLANFEFDLPPLDEQKRIADLLWAVERHRRCAAERSHRGSTALALRRSALTSSRDASACRLPIVRPRCDQLSVVRRARGTRTARSMSRTSGPRTSPTRRCDVA